MTELKGVAPYRNRETWSVGIQTLDNWSLKMYLISSDEKEQRNASAKLKFSDSTLQFIEREILWPRDDAGYGFATLHFGEEAVWLLVDIWENDILRHFLYRAPLSSPSEFTECETKGTMACVWELAVIVHERSAWIDHVMSKPANPDFESYLSDVISIQA